MFEFVTKALAKIFGTKSEKDLKSIMPIVELIRKEYQQLRTISDDELRGKTFQIKSHLSQELSQIDQQIAQLRISAEGTEDLDAKNELFTKIDALEKERNKELEAVLLRLLPLAFAVVRETARRLAENGKLEVEAQAIDHSAIERGVGNIELKGKNAIWHNKWTIAGTEVVWDMVHYDVQLIGGIVLHQGKIAEMSTGEGKTLVSTLPSYLNGLAERGVHIVTVNDYLAKRDSQWMAPLLEFHGVTVDCIDRYEAHSELRKAAYRAHVTYGTNNEFGFDYLRDNMVRSPEDMVQRKHHFAMVDEVDSVLIDDARTPLIISGPIPRGDQHEFDFLKPRVARLAELQRKLVSDFLSDAKKLLAAGKEKDAGLALLRAHRGLPKFKPLIKFLSEQGMKQLLLKIEGEYMQDNSKLMPQADKPLYFTIDEKNNTVDLTERGIEFITSEGDDPNFFVLPNISTEIHAIEHNSSYSPEEKLKRKDETLRDYGIKSQRIHSVNQLLKAWALFERDVDYVVLDGKVKIVDEQTGRILEGRRYSDGLHQALEAKENVKVEELTQTYATITLQNYFRMYHKLAGMTGTAETEAGEFWEIYKLDVVTIPTNRPVIRTDQQDQVFKTMREKYNAVAEEIQKLVAQGRPVLVGTTSVENSEIISRMLNMRKIPHQVLNAKQHAKEADIVAQAGRPGTVTIATNMAGRGTDIKLTPESRAAGGLAIIGTERHDSRRVDRQLRGRSGRQGDPGSSRFYVSLQDDLMRRFGSDRIAKIMDRMGLQEGEVIEHSWITKSIENAQKKVEENNFGSRKRLLEYDDVMNKQREVIYRKRRNALFGERLSIDITNLFADTCATLVNAHQFDYEALKLSMIQILGMEPPFEKESYHSKADLNHLSHLCFEHLIRMYQDKNQRIAQHVWPFIEDVYRSRSQQVKEVAVPFSDGQKVIQVSTSLDAAYQTQCKSLVKAMEQAIVLAVIDDGWKEHLREMDDLKERVRTAYVEQKDPLLIYKGESFELFSNFLAHINAETSSFLAKSYIFIDSSEQIQAAKPTRRVSRPKLQESRSEEAHADKNETETKATKEAPRPVVSQKIHGRNDKVTVRYADGTIKKDVKYKQVESEILSGKCEVL
jgi:preprotein translocase subunit SecA